MSKTFNLYLGQSGHMLVMSELLYRGWNVAIPQVDRGDDIFVVEDSIETLKAVQVKTSIGKRIDSGFTASFNLKLSQLIAPDIPKLYYIFVVRIEDKWGDFLVINRQEFFEKLNNTGFNPKKIKNILHLKIKYNLGKEKVWCRKINLWEFKNNWTGFPIIRHSKIQSTSSA